MIISSPPNASMPPRSIPRSPKPKPGRDRSLAEQEGLRQQINKRYDESIELDPIIKEGQRLEGQITDKQGKVTKTAITVPNRYCGG